MWQSSSMRPVAETKYGPVRGQTRDGVSSFLGIPYAASPTGARRFQAPEPPQPWSEVREASAFGPTPPKPDYGVPYDKLLPEQNIPGEDWLNLSVWTPDPEAAGLPVMVWIHGGAFANGNSAVTLYDGHPFARDGVVFVGINYRLGVDGFALIPGAPANRGLLDQIAALEWVRDNISAFGGDPAKVTVAGESAGAMSVVTLLAMPRAAGLFAQAIAQSGSVQSAALPDDAAKVTAELISALDQAGVHVPADASASDLAEVDLQDLVAAQAAVSLALSASPDPARFGASVVASSLAFVPVIDGDSLPSHPLEAIAAGSGSGVPLLIGTNAEEFRFFLVPTGMISMINDEVLTDMAPRFGATSEVIATYRANRPEATPGDVLAALITDAYFLRPAVAVAQARAGGPAPTYFYEFTWRSPLVGAGHAIELPFVFDNLAAEGAEELIGDSAPQSLARDMHAAWVQFAVSGDPGWPASDASRPVRIFDAAGGSVSRDPHGDELAAWSG